MIPVWGDYPRAVPTLMIPIKAALGPAMAYIDPSTGGMLFQILAAVFGSLSVIVLVFSRQIKVLVARVSRAFRRGAAPSEQARQSSGSESDSSESEGNTFG